MIKFRKILERYFDSSFLDKVHQCVDDILVPALISFVTTLITTLMLQFPFFFYFSEITNKLILLGSLPFYMILAEENDFNLKEKNWITLKNKKTGDECSVFLISPRLYADEFSTVSPLDRCALIDYLKKINLGKYKTIVIDIDLAPIYKGKNKKLFEYYSACQKRLDNFIISLSKSGKKIILLDPKAFFSSKDLPLFYKSLENWKNKLKTYSNSNIEFASPMIPLTIGCAIFYKSKDKGGNLTLGAKAFGVKNKERILINYFDIKFLPYQSSKSNVAFIGANYNSQDRFLSLRGELPGVIIHAMGGLSFISPKKFVFPEEIGFNTVFGVISTFLSFIFFVPLWSKYEKIKRENKDQDFCLKRFFLQKSLKLIVLASLIFCSIVVLNIIRFIILKFNVFILPLPILLSIWGTLYYKYVLYSSERLSYSDFNCFEKISIRIWRWIWRWVWRKLRKERKRHKKQCTNFQSMRKIINWFLKLWKSPTFLIIKFVFLLSLCYLTIKKIAKLLN